MRLAPVMTAAVLLMATAETAAHAADTQAVIAGARERIEATDSRATGRLVQVDASGKRISKTFSIKAHWFPGVLDVLIEIAPARNPAENAPSPHPDERVSVLLEMRPKGQSTIRVFHPHEAAPALLPFDQWSQGVAGGDFNYEDLLQPEYYWQGQTIVKSARLGAHDCDVLRSAPGASDRSHYAGIETWIDRAMGYPVYVEKTTKNTGSVKEFTSFGLSQSGGVWAARQVEVKVRGRAGSTLLMIERGSTHAKLTSKDFSPVQISRSEDRP